MSEEQIRDMLLEADPDIDHYHSDSKGDYTIWQEYEESNLHGDDEAQGWKFQVERWTRQEFDPIAKKIRAVLKKYCIPNIHQVEYDSETGYIRHLFDCEAP